jgi:hypothetical protein
MAKRTLPPGRTGTGKDVWDFCPVLVRCPPHLKEPMLKYLRESMREAEARLTPHRAEVPKAWRRHTMPNVYFPNECFPQAVYFVKSSRHLPDPLYVFGKAALGGIGQWHGWVEIGDVVFDGVLQEFYGKDGYYASEHAEALYRFTRGAAMYLDRTLTRRGLTNRWDAHLGLPSWADPDRTVLHDLDSVKRLWAQRQARRRK